jgi:hypothetical protein
LTEREVGADGWENWSAIADADAVAIRSEQHNCRPVSWCWELCVGERGALVRCQLLLGQWQIHRAGIRVRALDSSEVEVDDVSLSSSLESFSLILPLTCVTALNSPQLP